MKRLVRYTFYRIAKRIIRLFVTLSLIVSICFGSVFCQYEKVDAGAVGAAVDVVSAIGSMLGLANITSGGSVTGLFAEQKQKIQTWWDDNVAHGGIYLDQDNNYVFSGEATNALYESLDANSSTDAKVVSSFPAPSLNVPAEFHTRLNSWRAQNDIPWSNILKIYCSVTTGQDSYFFCEKWYDISNVSFINLDSFVDNSDYNYGFKNSSGSRVACSYAYSSIIYKNNDYSNFKFNSGSEGAFALHRYTGGSPGPSYVYISDTYSTLDDGFVFFPFSNVYCYRSIILSKSVFAGNAFINKKDGLYITNNYYGSVIPPISKTVFEENNWDSVYNSYVNNINTNSENWYVDGEVDVQALRDEMAKQSNIIKDAIIQGNIDIADKIDYTNEWLKKIYNLMKEIKTLVANNQGGGGSSSTDLTGIENQLDLVNTNFSELISKLDGVSSDLEDVLQALYSIESFSQSIDTKLDDLEQSYLVLSNIYSYMQSHPWGSGGGGGGPFITPTDDPWAPWFHYIDDDDGANFPYGAILTKYNIIKTLIQGAAPYCFIAFIGGVLNSLEVEPVTPEFTIPVKSNGSIVQVDEELHFDLSGFEILLPYIHAMFIILFTVGLMWFSFPFIRNLIQIFDL